MRWHAGKTTFFTKNTSNVTPNMFIKSVQNDPEMESRSGPRDTSKEKQQNFPKVYQKAQKVDQKAPQNDPKKDLKIIKNGLGGLLFHIKKTMIIWKLFFLVFCPPREVPDPGNQAKTL